MTKYFTIVANGLTPEQEKVLVEKWKNYAWWHGVPNFWLFRDTSDIKTAPMLRDEIRAIAPAANVLVIESAPTMWASGPMNESNREWLRKWWPPEGR